MTACPPPDSTAGEHRLHGRTRELEALDRILTPEGSDVWLVTGVPGIGKSALLRGWCARTHATPVVLLDGRAVEPLS